MKNTLFHIWYISTSHIFYLCNEVHDSFFEITVSFVHSIDFVQAYAQTFTALEITFGVISF